MSQDAGKVEKSNDKVTITIDLAVSILESYRENGIISSDGRIQHETFEKIFRKRNVKGVKLISKETRRKCLRYICNIRYGIYHGASFTPTRASMEAMVVPTYITTKTDDIIRTKDIKTVIRSTSDVDGSEILEAAFSANSYIESIYINNPACFSYLKEFAPLLINATNISVGFLNPYNTPHLMEQGKHLELDESDVRERYKRYGKHIGKFKLRLSECGFDIEKQLKIKSINTLNSFSLGVYINVNPLHKESWSFVSNPLPALFLDKCDFIPKQNSTFNQQQINEITL